jgi:hypothetical protein
MAGLGIVDLRVGGVAEQATVANGNRRGGISASGADMACSGGRLCVEG